MNDLNKLYKAMLMSWGVAVKPDYQLVLNMEGVEIPLKVDGMNLYLPVSEVIEGNTMEKVFFHPACENITSKETEIFKIIRRLATVQLLTLFKKYPAVLVNIANGTQKRSWPQHVLDLLEPLKAVKRNVLKELSELCNQMQVEIDDNGTDRRFLHLKVSKGGGRSQGGTGQKVYYKTKPVFPFYNEVIKRLTQSEGQADNQTVELNGHSVSRAALKALAHLFQSVIPACQNPDDYTFESTNSAAARLTSYLGCYNEIAEQFNKIQNIFRAEFDKVNIYPIELSWTEQLEELPETYRQVPAMDYNTHNTQEEGEQQAKTVSSLGNMFSVNSNQHQQQQQVQNNNQGHNVQQNNQPQQPGYVDGYDTTVPPLVAGDRWLRYEIDTVNRNIIHHCINTMTNAPVYYYCSRFGNLIQRVEGQPNTAVSPNVGAMGGMGGVNLGMINPALLALQGLMPGGLAGLMGMGYQAAPTTAGTTSVVSDNSNGGAVFWN